jgi:hypothetical protein
MTDDPKRPLKVFLCHAHSDAAEVRALYSRLKTDGVDAWMDKESLIPGANWELEIRKAVREADIVVVCLSKQFNQRGFRQKEVRLALDTAMEMPEGEIFIIPARLEECDYLESLQQYHGVDLFEAEGYSRLMRALRLRAEKIGATLQSKKGILERLTAPVVKPVTKKSEIVEKEPAPKSTPRKLPQFNFDPKNAFRAFLGIVVLLGVVLGIPRITNYFSQMEFPTPFPTSTSTFIPTFTPPPPTLTFTPALPRETSPPVFTPTSAPLADEIVDAKGIIMRLVSAGIFKMGEEFDEEKPIHDVYLDNYYMDIYEVTNAAYKACVDDGTCQPPVYTGKYNNSIYVQHPVVYVDWYKAKIYCEWRGANLPTESEWEEAARGTDQRSYPWGEDISCDRANYNNCVGDTTKVGSYESGKSPYGMYDMTGNVWEWVSSLYKPYPYNANDGREDMNSSNNRVLRSGSWYGDGYIPRSVLRVRYNPTYSSDLIGFRCSRSP